MIPSIHPDGWRFVGIFAFITFVFFIVSIPLGMVGVLLTVWCYAFFRNPIRVLPSRENVITSPADGKIVAIARIAPPEALNMGTQERVRISIFLNIFNVHCQHMPFKGTIRKVLYHSGKFLNASFDKASDENECNTIVLDMSEGQDMAVVQIAGLIARRIRCDVREGDSVEQGETYGLIRFGSRCDIYLPLQSNILVEVGQTAIASETVLASMNSLS